MRRSSPKRLTFGCDAYAYEAFLSALMPNGKVFILSQRPRTKKGAYPIAGTHTFSYFFLEERDGSKIVF